MGAAVVFSIMRELDRIRHALSAAQTRGEPALLVTVMAVEGSVYRGAGARMVVTPGGDTIGAVSGGCLEADIVARAPDVFARNRAEAIQYDTRASDDVILGLGLGCQGVIDLLLEPLSGDVLGEMIALLDRLADCRDSVTVLTLVRANSSALAIGTRLVLSTSGEPIEGERALLEYPADVARETVRPATQLVVCGGGSDAIPVARLAKLIGWHVTIIDHRSSFITRERFPDAEALIHANLAEDPLALRGRITLDARTTAVVMAHAASHDRAYLHAMLDAGAGYVGVLGPRKRTVELLEGRGSSAEFPNGVHSPIGLDIGAETPEEIALAIVSEIVAATTGRDGGMLRDRNGPIHDRETASRTRNATNAETANRTRS